MGAKYLQSITSKNSTPIFTEKNKNIIINFDEIFDNPEFEAYNLFRMTIGKKRVYASYAPTICKDNNKILSLDPNIKQKVIYSYFTIKKAIDNKLFAKIDNDEDLKKYGVVTYRDFGKFESFINFLITQLFTPDFIVLIKKYVDKHYKNPVDESASEKYSPGTTFNNEHFKLFYTISIMSKFVIPLCTHYIYVNSDKNIDVYSFMYTVFKALFDIVVIDSNCSNLMDKLYQYVDKIVRRTENPNKPIWDMFPIYNETREGIIDELVVKIVTTILPKFDFNQQIIHLITVVARDTVGLYKIKANRPFESYRISDNDSSGDDEDSLSESDIFDMFYRNLDENIIVLNHCANDDTIDTICKRSGIVITPEEFNWYKKNYQLHNFTIKVRNMVFARFFSGSSNVESCTYDQTIKLMIFLIKKMKDLNINYLPHFITATRTSYTFTHMPSASVSKALKQNIDYQQLIEMKYRNVRSVFDIKGTNSDENNPIKDMIVSLFHNDYVYNEYGRPDLNGKPIQIDEDRVINDVIQLYKKMII